MFVEHAARNIQNRQSDVCADGISPGRKSSETIHHYVSFSSLMGSSVQNSERPRSGQKAQIITVLSMYECLEMQVIDINNGEISCF